MEDFGSMRDVKVVDVVANSDRSRREQMIHVQEEPLPT
jgi:hypothetical protein